MCYMLSHAVMPAQLSAEYLHIYIKGAHEHKVLVSAAGCVIRQAVL